MNKWLLLLFFPSFLFAQRTTVSEKKQKLFVFVEFDYGDFFVREESESVYVARMKQEKNAKKVGSGEKWEGRWNYDKKELYEPNFINGILSKIAKGGIADKKENADFVVTAKPMHISWRGYLQIEVLIADKSGTILNSEILDPIPTVSFPIGDIGVLIVDCYYMAGETTGKKIKQISQKE